MVEITGLLTGIGFDFSKLATIVGAIFALLISGAIMSYIMQIREELKTKVTSDLIYFLLGLNLVSIVITGIAIQNILNISSIFLTFVFATFIIAALLMWAKGFRALVSYFEIKPR